MNKQPLQNPWLATRTRTGSDYDAPYAARAAAGADVHGEANLVMQLLQATNPDAPKPTPYRVLDAGCGTGRIAIELARRGIVTVGVDLDEVMLAQARKKAPQLDWRLGDLSSIALDGDFDAIVLAGNVMIYLTPGTEAATLANLARYLKTGGLLIAAFELTPPSWSDLTIDRYDQLTQTVGLRKVARWSTWEQAPWSSADRYAVSVHTKPPDLTGF
jgi:SAM-dependent methyltransferase